MAYTKQQLIQAFCDAKKITPDQVQAELARMQEHIDIQRGHLQRSLNEIPESALAEAKAIALEYLGEQEKKRIFTENVNATL
jgi:hypothetical protein